VPPGGYLTVTWNFTALPNIVTWGILQLKYDLPLVMNGQNANNGTGGNFKGIHDLFLVDSAPVGVQQTPWVDLLKITCAAAHGRVGATQMANALTQGVHDTSIYSPGFANTVLALNSLDPRLPSGHTFNLEIWILGWMDGEPYIDACDGFATFLTICFNGMGITASNQMVCHTSMSFPTIPQTARGLKSILLDSAGGIVAVWETYEFSHHAYVVVGGLAYDPTSKRQVDLGGQTYNQPPKGWNHLGFIQTGTASPFRGTFQGLTNPLSIQQILSTLNYYDRSFTLR
jgi:hypothetical protein